MMKAAPVSSTASIPSSYLFRKVDMGGGHHYGLTSVERPCKYISRTRQSPDVLTLSDNYMECLLITDEVVSSQYLQMFLIFVHLPIFAE